MPKFNVMVTWTHTVERSIEIEVSAKDEESAQEKVESRIAKAHDSATESKPLTDAFDWTENDTQDDFEYDASEA